MPYGNEREIKPGGENAETGKGTASITASLVAATAPPPSNALLLRRPVLFALCENKWSLGIVLKFYDFLSRVGEGRTWGGVGRQGRERRGVAPRRAHQERHFEGGRKREGERRLVMNYAPPNARVKLRNCPHEYTQGREGWATRRLFPSSSKQNVTGEECDFASSVHHRRPRLRNGQSAAAAKHVIRRHLL